MAQHIRRPASPLRPPAASAELRAAQDAADLLRLLRQHECDATRAKQKFEAFSDSRWRVSLGLLLKKKLILSGHAGRPRKNGTVPLPRINAAYGHVVGIDIGGSNLRLALADLNGRMIAKWSTTTKRTSSPEMVIERIRTGVHDLLEQAGIRRRSLLAAAAGAPGVTNRDAGIVFATSYLKGWRDVPFGRLLSAALQVPTAIENDVRLAAIGEHSEGAARGIPDFVFLAIGTGIGAGIFVNGRLLHGPDWVAGEVGYLLVPGVPHAPASRGSPGALESAIGGEGIRQRWLRFQKSRNNGQAYDLSATGIFYQALTGDRRSRAILEGTARILAYAIYNISTILNSSLFVLGGGVGTNGPLLAETRRILVRYTQPSQPKLVASALGPEAQLVGAIRLALDVAEARIDKDILRISGRSSAPAGPPRADAFEFAPARLRHNEANEQQRDDAHASV